jgi:hypothetical protein
MKKATLNLKELQKDCSIDGHEYGESLTVLGALVGAEIELILDEEQYGEMLQKTFGLDEDGNLEDEFGIDWDKYDFVTVAATDEDGNPLEFLSFRANWLTEVKDIAA